MYVVRRRGARNIERLQHEMEGAFRSLVASDRPINVIVTSGRAPAWRPPVEVYETDDALVVLIELAGMREEQIEVIIDESVLTVSGNRSPVGDDRRCGVHEMGIRYGEFAADVFLPFPVRLDDIQATYEAGLLRIHMPRTAATRVNVAIEPSPGT